MKIQFDYSNLKTKIKQVYGKQSILAKDLGMSAQSLNNRLNNKVHFKYGEMQKILDFLDIAKKDAGKYFFIEKQQPIRTFYTPQEVAQALNVTTKTIYNYIQNKSLTAYKMGNYWRILEEDLNNFIKSLPSNQ